MSDVDADVSRLVLGEMEPSADSEARRYHASHDARLTFMVDNVRYVVRTTNYTDMIAGELASFRRGSASRARRKPRHKMSARQRLADINRERIGRDRACDPLLASEFWSMTPANRRWYLHASFEARRRPKGPTP